MESISDLETSPTAVRTLSRRAMLRTLALGVSAVTVTSLVGCVAPAASTAAGSEPIVLQIWHHLTASDGEVFNALLDQFNAANPEIQIAYQLVPGEELLTKIAAAIATGEPPDIGFRMMSDVSRWNRWMI